MKAQDINLKKLDDHFTITININLKKEFKIRLFLATRLIRIAARILNCNLEMEFNQKDREQLQKDREQLWVKCKEFQEKEQYARNNT